VLGFDKEEEKARSSIPSCFLRVCNVAKLLECSIITLLLGFPYRVLSVGYDLRECHSLAYLPDDS